MLTHWANLWRAYSACGLEAESMTRWALVWSCGDGEKADPSPPFAKCAYWVRDDTAAGTDSGNANGGVEALYDKDGVFDRPG